jgi:hypothetical protein
VVVASNRYVATEFIELAYMSLIYAQDGILIAGKGGTFSEAGMPRQPVTPMLQVIALGISQRIISVNHGPSIDLRP